MEKTYLTAGEVLALRSNLRTADVDAPGWGVVRVRQMTLRDRSDITRMLQQDGATDAQMAALLVARCVIDATGQRIFGDDDQGALLDSDPVPIDAIARRVLELSRVSKSDVEDAAKNSGQAESDDSSSALH